MLHVLNMGYGGCGRYNKKIGSLRLHVSTAVLVKKCDIKELKKREIRVK